MFRRSNSNLKIESLFVLAVLTMFAVTSLLLVIFGTKQYQSTVSINNENYEVRTTSSYLYEKVRSVNRLANVSVENVDGIPVLALSEVINDRTYITYIYSYEGWLRELYVSEEVGFTLGAGQTITEISNFDAVISDSLLQMTYVDSDSVTRECDIALRR